MIFEKGLDPGTVIHNLRVQCIRRGNPLTYLVTCIRPGCGGTFEIDHLRLTGLGAPWCCWAGCNEAARERANRSGYKMPEELIDPHRLVEPGVLYRR